MLEYNHYLELLKTTNETPEFAKRLQTELIELDSKLAALTAIFDKRSKIVVNILEAQMLERQRKGMVAYYEALCERCVFHKVADYMIDSPSTNCRASE
ncbi:MAG: hypothetical protein SNI70_10740 [Rikenellaceae bacterium]